MNSDTKWIFKLPGKDLNWNDDADELNRYVNALTVELLKCNIARHVESAALGSLEEHMFEDYRHTAKGIVDYLMAWEAGMFRVYGAEVRVELVPSKAL